MRFSKTEKEGLVIRYRAGESVTDISRKTGVKRGTLYSWIKNYDVLHKDKMSSQSAFILNKKIIRTEKLIAVLQKVNCTTTSPLKVKLIELEKLKEEYPVRILCDALNVDRGTFYNHIFRNKRENSSYNRRFYELCDIVENIFTSSNRVHGVTKITAILKKQNIRISEEYVRRIMHEKNLVSIRNTSKADYNALCKNKSDFVNCNFSTNRPNEVWVSDTTQLQIKHNTYYLCGILDLFSRKIIAYKINTKHTTNLISATFKMVYETRKPHDLIFHSDRGSQYSSKSFMLKLKSLGVTQSFTPPASPTRNAVKESFFNNFKREEFYRINYRSFSELKTAIAKYVQNYNDIRPHSYNNYKTPNEAEEIYYKKLTK